MDDEFEQDIKSTMNTYTPEEYGDDPKSTAYLIAEQVIKDTEAGFIIVGSPNMGETEAGYMFPDSIGLVINHDIGLTPSGLASILEELARQLASSVSEVEKFLKEEAETDE